VQLLCDNRLSQDEAQYDEDSEGDSSLDTEMSQIADDVMVFLGE
jgi:hypothetical protein